MSSSRAVVTNVTCRTHLIRLSVSWVVRRRPLICSGEQVRVRQSIATTKRVWRPHSGTCVYNLYKNVFSNLPRYTRLSRSIISCERVKIAMPGIPQQRQMPRRFRKHFRYCRYNQIPLQWLTPTRTYMGNRVLRCSPHRARCIH